MAQLAAITLPHVPNPDRFLALHSLSIGFCEGYFPRMPLFVFVIERENQWKQFHDS